MLKKCSFAWENLLLRAKHGVGNSKNKLLTGLVVAAMMMVQFATRKITVN